MMDTMESLVDRHEQSLRNFSLSLTKSEDRTDDIVQDTWIKAMNHLMLLNTMSPEKQRSWLFSVLKNRFLDLCRQQKREQSTCSQRFLPLQVNGNAPDWENYLTCLNPQEKDIVFKRYWLGYNSRQISAELRIPEGTVRWRLKLAMEKLKTIIIQSSKEE